MSAVYPPLDDIVDPEALADARCRALDSHSIVSISDTNGRITYANAHFCDLMGYSAEELIGQTYGLIDSKHHPPEFFQDLWDQVNTGESWVGEVCNRARTGEFLWFDNIVVPLFGKDGLVTGHFSVRKNITKRKEAEARLTKSENFLNDVSYLAEVGGWSLDLAEGRLFWSEQTKRIHDVPQDYVPALEKAIDFYAPEARSAITHAVEAAMSTGESWDLELPMITATGRSIWVRAVGHAMFENGDAVSIVGAFQDITKRKFAEDVLREEVSSRHSAEQLLRDILETLPDAVAAYDHNDQLIVCNSAYLETYAISADAIVPGASFESILRCGLARGQYENAGDTPEAHEAWLQERLRQHNDPPEHLTQRLLDGTWLQVREHRSPTGATVGVRTDITGLKRAESELRKLAETDQMTGLLNRRSFCQRLDTLVENATEGPSSNGCLALFDIDHFKPINDAYGHDVGDEVLIEVGQRLRGILGPDDFAARLGGDEYVFVLAGRSSRVEHQELLEKFFQRMRAPIDTRASSVRIGISLGAVEIENAQTPSRLLLKFADLAQYRSKQEGRGNWRWFSRQDATNLKHESKVVRALEADLRNGEGVTYALAPIVGAHDAEPAGFAGDTRWSFEGKTYTTSCLHGLAQKCGQVARLCTRTMETAIAAMGQAQEMGAQTGHLWLTASADHMRLDGFVETLETTRKTHGLEAHDITVAVEEPSLIDRSAAAIESAFETLTALGYRVAVDDFGRSAISLSGLQKLGVHAVRLHHSLTDPLASRASTPSAEDETHDQLLRGLIAMADALDIEVIGFNVSSPTQAAVLAQLGCDAMQGPLIGAAVDADGLPGYLAERARRQLANILETERPASPNNASSIA
jgi:diguanylate cyclase (GGDEF)-like protein/PAS domain S-box-containing protein